MTDVMSSRVLITLRHSSPLYRLGIVILLLYLIGITIFLWSVNFWCRIKESQSSETVTLTQQSWHIEKRGEYTVLPHYVRAEMTSELKNTVTYAVSSTYSDLKHLSEICNRWKGPVSAAIYAPGSDFQTALHVIFRLRLFTGNTCIRQNVTFHLYYDSELGPSPNEIRPPEYEANVLNTNAPVIFDGKRSFKYHVHLPFPANVGRNVAVAYSKTEYVLAGDMRLYPSADIPDRFVKMPELQSVNNHIIYVLPVYKVSLETEIIPNFKYELSQLSSTGKAVIPVGIGDCNDCHVFPKASGWLDTNPPNNTISIYNVVRKGKKFKTWQPYFISSKNVPRLDEEMTKEGRLDRISQAIELCFQHYEFHILDNAFLILINDIEEDGIQDETLLFSLTNRNNKVREKTLEVMTCRYGTEMDC